jgi:purine nucleosidase
MDQHKHIDIMHAREEEYYKRIMSTSKHSVTGNKGVKGLRQAKKIIIDCDPGGDDCQAMILAFDMAKKRGIEILGVTTVAGNGTLEHVVLNAQMVLHACGELEVPILRGEEPFIKGKELSEYFYGPDGFGWALLEYQEKHLKVEETNIREESAVDFLIRMAKVHPGEITILGLAPLTNLAVA